MASGYNWIRSGFHIGIQVKIRTPFPISLWKAVWNKCKKFVISSVVWGSFLNFLSLGFHICKREMIHRRIVAVNEIRKTKPSVASST